MVNEHIFLFENSYNISTAKAFFVDPNFGKNFNITVCPLNYAFTYIQPYGCSIYDPSRYWGCSKNVMQGNYMNN